MSQKINSIKKKLSSKLDEILSDFNFSVPVKGNKYNVKLVMPVTAQSITCGTIQLSDGRKAQVQLTVTTDEDEFID